VSLGVSEGATSAPPLLTESDLIATMEKEGIGTDATIADHIQTILDRGYAEKLESSPPRFIPKPLGLSLVWAFFLLKAQLFRPFLRRQVEQDLVAICNGSKRKEAVEEDCISHMKPLYEQVAQSYSVIVNTTRDFLRTPGNEAALESIRSYAMGHQEDGPRDLSAFGGRYLQDDGGPPPKRVAQSGLRIPPPPPPPPPRGGGGQGARPRPPPPFVHPSSPPPPRGGGGGGGGGGGQGARPRPSPPKERRCGICRQPGHNRRNCPMNPAASSSASGIPAFGDEEFE
jgi:DNA topoisomerase III